MLDIFFYEAFDKEAELLRQHMPESIQAEYSWKTIQESGHEKPPARLISTRTQSSLPESWVPQLAGILSRSTGYDHLLRWLADTENPPQCGYLPLYCHRSVAEQALTLWMALLRKLPRQIGNFPKFHREGLTGLENEGKTLLVVGVGNIGYEVVKIGWGLGMRVLGVDIDPKHPDVEYVDPQEGIRKADIIVAAMNLTEDNRGYFHYDFLKQAPRGALFVNVARGELSPSGALVRLVTEEHLGGVGLDVYDRESELAVLLRSKKESNDPEVQATLQLAKNTNIILTPHNAFNTIEAVERKAAQSVEQVVHFFEKSRFKWPVPVDGIPSR